MKLYKAALFHALKASKEIFRFWKLVQEFETCSFQQGEDSALSSALDLVKQEVVDPDIAVDPSIEHPEINEDEEDAEEPLNEVDV